MQIANAADRSRSQPEALANAAKFAARASKRQFIEANNHLILQDYF
jgi:hypothetical protein